jgi:hypothetical protein
MKRISYLACFCLLLGLAATCPAVFAAEVASGWKAGVARAVITPATDVWLAGYGTRRAPDGKLHDLWLKVLALEDARGNRAVLITSDFQGVPRSMSDRVFAALKDKHHLDRRQVMFTFSHNHCGPRLGDDLIDYYPVDDAQEQLVREYTDRMVEQTVAVVAESLERLAPAELATGAGQATFAVNRRNNQEEDVPRLIAEGKLVGPVDHRVPVMKVTRPDGAVAAILFGYACHPTTLNFNTWNGDYPGFAQLELEAAYPGACAMFVNTCGGDQNPLPRRSVELCQKYGHELAAGALAALAGKLETIDPQLATAFSLVELDYLEVTSREQLIAAAADESNAIQARWARRLLKQLDAGTKFPSAYPYPVHVWRLGQNTHWIGLGAESVVDYSLRFQREYGPSTWVMGYADDMLAYIPSRRVWEEGGYEGGARLYEYGRPALRWAGDVEERIAKTVQRLMAEVDQP